MTALKFRIVVACVGAALAIERPALADDLDLENLLNESIITTASKSSEKSSTAPATRSARAPLANTAPR